MKHYIDPTTNRIYAYEADGSQDSYINPSFIAITDDEANLIRAKELQDSFNALTYSEKRAMEYPPIPDQLDMIFHNGLDIWKAAIQAIKDKYPKE